MTVPFEGRSFRLKQGSEEKSVAGQFDGAYLSVRSRGSNLQSAIRQARHVGGIRTEAATIGLANLVGAVDLTKPASRHQMQGFVNLNQRTS